MGHAEGLITINIAEADDVKRVRAREKLGNLIERCWDISVTKSVITIGTNLSRMMKTGLLNFDSVFGNEEMNYNNALQTYYNNGTPSTGRTILSAPTPQRIPGKIGPRPGLITSMLWIHWKRPIHLACG